MALQDAAQASATEAEYGTSSLEILSGTASCMYNDSAPDAELSLGGGLFTAELSVKFNSVQTEAGLMGKWRNNLLTDDWSLAIVGGNLQFAFRDSGFAYKVTTAAFTPNTTDWYKVAVDYDGTDTRLYLDGVVQDTQTFGAATKASSNVELNIGIFCNAVPKMLDGWIDEVRITQGVARYAGGYTPATARFPDDVGGDSDFASVTLLLHFDDLDGGDCTLEEFTVDGELFSGDAVVGAEGNSFMPEFSVAGGIDSGCITQAFTVSATGVGGSNGVGDIRPLAWTVSGATAGITLPLFSVAATGFDSALIQGDIILPLRTLSGAIDAPLALPLYTVAGVMESGNLISGDIVLLAPTVNASFGFLGDMTLPEFQSSATGFAGSIYVGDITLPKFSLDAVMYENTTASGDITLAAYQVSGIMGSSGVITGSITLPLRDVSATGFAGSVSSASLTLPLYEVDATGYPQVVGSAQIELMAFQVDGRMDGPAAALNLTTIALNTQVRAVTLYEGLAFNSFANFAGYTLAASADGIVALTGADDLGDPINAYAAGGISDFGSQRMKRVLTGYVGYKADGNMELTLISDDHHEFIYRLEPRQGAEDLHESRVKFGRGIASMYVQWRLANTDGGDFRLDKMTLNADELKRGV